MKNNYLLENTSLVQQKKGKIDNDGKISDGYVSIKDHLTCEKVWNKFSPHFSRVKLFVSKGCLW